MTNPTLWADAGSQLIWTYYLANLLYNFILGFGVILAILCIWYGGISILRWHVYRDGLVRNKTNNSLNRNIQ